MQIEIRCSYEGLKDKSVIDKDGERIGRIVDAVFDEKLILTKFVIGGSRLEEWLEDRGLRPDIDPLVPIATISRVKENLHLNVSKDTLKTTLDLDGIGENENKFTEIMKFPILDSNKLMIGKIKSYCINPDLHIDFIISGDELNPKLSEKHSIYGLIYAFTRKDISSKEDNRLILKQSLQEIEIKLKHDINFALIHSSEVAWQDGKISKDEFEILQHLEVDAEIYDNALKDALEDDVITDVEELELEKLKENLIHKAYNTAVADKVITREEGAIIDRLANYMIDRRKKLFWQVFGTYKDSRSDL